MNWNTIEGKWTEFQGVLKDKWGKLTDNDMQSIGGKRDRLVGRLQQLYGKKRDEIESDVDVWLSEFGKDTKRDRIH